MKFVKQRTSETHGFYVLSEKVTESTQLMYATVDLSVSDDCQTHPRQFQGSHTFPLKFFP